MDRFNLKTAEAGIIAFELAKHDPFLSIQLLGHNAIT